MPIDNNYPIVTLAAPIRNRQDFLPYYLDAISKQSFPQSNTCLLFVLNNSTDQSEKILNDFKKQYQDKYMKIRIETYNRPNIPEDVRSTNIRTAGGIYSHLAEIRNYICQQTKTEWLFSVDSDVFLLPNTLEQLLNSSKKCISALINNGHKFASEVNDKAQFKCDRVKAEMFTNIMRYNANGQLVHVPQSEWNGIIKVNMTGAVYLLHRDIFKNCKYSYSHLGEDIPFSQDVERLGESLWCNTNIKLPHCMTLELLEKYKKGEFIF